MQISMFAFYLYFAGKIFEQSRKVQVKNASLLSISFMTDIWPENSGQQGLAVV